MGAVLSGAITEGIPFLLIPVCFCAYSADAATALDPCTEKSKTVVLA